MIRFVSFVNTNTCPSSGQGGVGKGGVASWLCSRRWRVGEEDEGAGHARVLVEERLVAAGVLFADDGDVGDGDDGGGGHRHG